MGKEKIVKPDGRWMYLYTFEEEPSSGNTEEQEQKAQEDSHTVKSET